MAAARVLNTGGSGLLGARDDWPAVVRSAVERCGAAA